MNKILISTQDHLGEYKTTKTLGLVRGNTVRSRDAARNLLGSLRTIFGGEIPQFTKAVTESREQALNRMIEHANELGADAIVAVRFITAEIGQTCTEIMVYGTAIKLQK